MTSLSQSDARTLPPSEFLEYLQAYYAEAAGITFKDGSIPLTDKTLERVIARFGRELRFMLGGEEPLDWIKRNSKAKFPLGEHEGILGEIVKGARRLLSQTEWDLFLNVPKGVVLEPHFNAHAVAVPSGGQVIVLNYELLAGLGDIFVNFLSLIFQVFGFEGPIGLQAQLQSKENFVSTLRRRLAQDLEAQYKIARLPMRESIWMIEVCKIIQLFILLHEMGHVALGHLNEVNLRSLHPSDSASNSIKYYAKEQEEEFAADLWAARKLAHMRNDSTKLSGHHEIDMIFDPLENMKVGLPMLFYVMHIYHQLFGSVEADAGTHPPPLERLDRLCRGLFGVSDLRSIPQANDIHRISEWVLA